MRMSNVNLGWIAFLSMAVIPSAAVADLDVNAHLTCPTEANAGDTLTINLSLENSECSAVNVRILSSIAGNTSQTVAGAGIFGPAVAIPMAVVPAATNVIGGCFGGFCGFTGQSCSVDTDCPSCSGTTPGALNLIISAPPAIPSSLVGTVATHVVITEFEAGQRTDTEVDACFVEVL